VTDPGPKEAWRNVRRKRAAPTAIASVADDRRLVYQSALAQAEELWDAAAVAGPASRPLPLFYCMSQASRAVIANWTATEPWQPRAHGLGRREGDGDNPGEAVFNYGAEPRGGRAPAFAMFAVATRSQTFSGTATVADLWASLPGFPTPRDLFGDRPRCLTIEPASAPGDERPIFARIGAPTHCVLSLGSRDRTVDELTNTYPTMRGMTQDGSRTNVLGWEEPLYKFVETDGTLRPLYEVGERPHYAPPGSGSLVVRPTVGTAWHEPPSEAVTLWALLFCLSELARYYPDVWVAALDPDTSAAAVTLEHGLDIALERAPDLIATALGGPLYADMRDEIRRMRAGGPTGSGSPSG
jgi:YaaC-like Protein